MSRQHKIILASSSAYRKALLERLKLEFEVVSPEIDESPQPQEPATSLVLRLALGKAREVAKTRSNALIIGADQVAELEGKILLKPGSRDNAVQQLRSMRGRTVRFITGLCVLNSVNQHSHTDTDIYNVSFRDYSDKEIERYLDLDTPYDCAGSFKSEQMGITLMEKMQGDDPTALVGLPLIKLAAMLRQEGVELP